MKLSDDEAICTALLHGAKIEQAFAHTEYVGGLWYLDLSGPYHPIEEENDRVNDSYGFKTAAELALAYCDYYNLGG